MEPLIRTVWETCEDWNRRSSNERRKTKNLD